MRRTLLAALTAALAVASPAYAAHHLMQVDEVAPGGSQAEQFIELRDSNPGGEPFPNPAYSVAATDAAGAVIPGAVQDLAPGPLRNTTAPFLIGGTGVSPRDTELEFLIPAQAARVCFYDNGVAAGFPINCLNYGNVTVPPGQSAQRQSCGVVAAPPSPDAVNGETGCGAGGGGGGTGGGGGGGGGGTGGGGEAEDLTRPQQKVAGRRRQDVDRLAVTVTLDEAGRVTARGRVNVPGGASRVFRFRPVTRAAAENEPVRLRLRLARAGRRAVKAAIADGRRLRARVTVTARDAAGNPSTARKAIRLTD